MAHNLNTKEFPFVWSLYDNIIIFCEIQKNDKVIVQYIACSIIFRMRSN